MGILEGKSVLVAGVTMNTSIGYRIAELAAEQGSLSVAVALNALHRLTAPPRPEQLAIDQLALVVEPAANCARYDSLRQVHHG